MVRLGWILFAVGLMAAAWIAFRFYLALVVDPTANDPVWGFLMAFGFCVSVAVAVTGAVLIAKARGIMDPTALIGVVPGRGRRKPSQVRLGNSTRPNLVSCSIATRKPRSAMLRYLAFALALLSPIHIAPTALGQAAEPIDDDRANELFRAMEQRLAKANSLECAFTITTQHPEAAGEPREVRSLEGSLLLAEGNRIRLEMNERTEGRPLFHLMASDGRRLLWGDMNNPPRLVEEKPSATLNADFLTMLTRTGLYMSTMPLPPVPAGARDRFPVSGLRLGRTEQVGGREAQRLEYRLFVKGQKDPEGKDLPFPVSVWLDRQTSLPLRRVVRMRVLGMTELVILETYGRLVLDSVPDARGFQLLAVDPPQGDALRKERRSLGGTWVVESIVRDPRERGEGEGKGFKVVIIGEKVVVKAPGEDKSIAGLILRIDPTKEPKTLDLWVDETPFGKTRKDTFKEPPVLAIYELSGDTLRVCWAPLEKRERPTEFASKAETGHSLVMLRREKP